VAPAGSDGCRIGEVLALTRADLLPDGLLIDESALDGHPSTTEHKKSRTVPIPASLRSELEEWLAEHNHSLMFPTQAGKMHHRGDLHLREVVKRARSAAKIPDLTSRMCRNTFGSLFEGDVKDAQEILGHHSAAFTLQVYKKPLAERQQTAVEDVDRRLKVVPIKKGVA
jgi:integrase